MSVNIIGLKSYEDLFKDDKGRKTEEIVPMDIKELKPYAEQPFKVLLDSSMDELCESIAQNGVLSPIIARPHPEGGYEILSGHRRVKACELLRIEEVPVVVKNLDDDTAAILLVDSNLQRENILPSEKAFAYKLKLEAMNRKLGRPSKENVGQIVPDLLGKRSTEIVGEQYGDSYKQVQRYIRLTNLIYPLLDLVDKNEMAMSAGVELSYLGTKHQAKIYEVVERESPPSIAQASKLRKCAKEGNLDDKMIENILSSEKEQKVKLVIYEDKLRRYFPKNYTKEQIEDTVMKLIQKWHKNREKENER
jgi:ParB family chromosome partitioning protein